MTVIIGAVAGDFAFHASDRLVSKLHKGTVNDWDPIANKCVIVVAEDAVFTIGYTGIAYIQGKSTDIFLAEAVSGLRDSRGLLHIGRLKIGRVWDVVVRIRNALTEAFSDRRLNGHNHAVVLSGLRFDRRHQHILWVLKRKTASSNKFELEHLERKNAYRGGFQVALEGMSDRVTENNLRQDAMVCRRESPTAFRDCLVRSIQQTSSRLDGVGDNCMTVVLRISQTVDIETHYVPGMPTLVAEKRLRRELFYPAYSPYLVTPGGVIAPAIVRGAESRGEWQIGSVRYKVTTRQLGVFDNSKHYFGLQPRKPPPR